jgi:hypothetical protein
MKYEKPELLQLASAMKAVQNPDDKSEQEILDSAHPPLLASAAAYAADE